MGRIKTTEQTTNDNVVQLKRYKQIQAPKNGERYEVYDFDDVLKTGGWVTVARNKRQRGKINEAQRFRRAQGAYLAARLHFRELTRQAQSNLQWWFSSTLRAELHCRIMMRYYLYDEPTHVSDLLESIPRSTRNIMAEIKTATELGSIEVDALASDKRKRVIYPTRGLIADTDNLFGRSTGEQNGHFTYWGELIDQIIRPVEANDRYRLSDYKRDFDSYNDLVATVLPDTDREF